MILFLISVFSLSVIYICYQLFVVRPTIPKGLKEIPLEKGYPILGILPQIEAPFANYLSKLGQKHGPLFRIRLGMRDIVVLNDFDFVKKSLKENGNIYSGRMKTLWIAKASYDSGILFVDGDKWAKQRSFILSVLRDFGLGKAKSLEFVQNECKYLIDELRGHEGKCVDFADMIPLYTANIISKFIINKRYSKEDPGFSFILKMAEKIGKGKDLLIFFQLMFPFFDDSKILDKIIMTLSPQWHMFDQSHDYFQEEIEEHRKRLDLHSEGEDLIDKFLIRQHETKEKTGTVETFTDFQLVRNLLELFTGGFETTSTTLVWSLFFMSIYPDIQEKVHHEIVDRIGNERMPNMNDKKVLDYTQAVMDEVMRLSIVVPLAFNHRTLEDSTINGYFIPKDSIIIPNLFACHFDSNTWEKPTEFRPKRFLTIDNDGELKYTAREELIPFSLGKRQCLGESLARMEYFIFFVSIMQKFKVLPLEEINQERYEDVLRGNDGIIRSSKVHDFIFYSRI